MRTSRRLLKQVRRALLVAFLFSGCINALMLATPIYTLQVFETVVPSGSIETLILLTGMAGATLLALMLLEMIRDRILLRAGLWLDHVLGQHLLDNGLKAGLAPRDMQAELKSLATLRSFLTGPLINALFDAPWTPLFLVSLALLHPLIGMVGLVTALILLIAGSLLSLTTGTLLRETQQAIEKTEQWWRTVTGRAQTVGALGLTKGASEQWEAFNRTHIAGAYSLGKRTSFIKAVARATRTAAQIGVYAVGAWLVIRGELSPGALVAAAILLARALAPLEMSVSAFKALGSAFTAYRRLKAHVADVTAPLITRESERPSGHLIMTDVTFYHPTRRTPSLKNVSLAVVPGETLAIVGPNGAGKSTLAAVIAGASDPQVGSTALDGVPTARWQRSDGILPIGYLPDDSMLIEGTVHDNIARFREASLMAVARAGLRVGVHETIAALPNGYDTLIGAGGEGLSLRERRAVAMARAAFGDPKIIVLDEPELGLDGGSVRALVKVLEVLKRSGTSLVLATQDQRLLTLADRIVLLNEGAVLAFGPARDVLARMQRGSMSGAPASLVK